MSAESDEQLTDRVRSGDQGAFGELYRRHRRAAESTARCLLRSRNDADDVVADAFAGVLSAIRNGHGPRDNFRRYLMACVRNGCRTRHRTIPIAPEDHRFEPSRPDAGPQMLEDPERYVEADTVARAFSALAPRWQQMLWSTAVEQKSAQEVGLQMQLSPNAVAALNHRAREAFATAYLAEHSAVGVAGECTAFAPHLAGYVRGQLPPARFAAVDRHVEACASCTRAVDDLRDINASLRSLGPAPLAAVAMVAAPAMGGGSTSGTTSFFNASYGGALLKGVAGLLLLAPLVVTGVELFNGGDSSPVEPIREVREATTTIVADPATDEDPPQAAAADSPRDAESAVAQQADADDAADAGDAGDEGASGQADGAGGTGRPTPAVVAGPPPNAGENTGANGPGVTAPSATVVPTTSAPATRDEGLLGTLGVDDLVSDVGLPQLVEAVVTLDAIVLTVTRDVVAPVLDAVLSVLPVEIDPAVLPSIPGVVLLPDGTTATSAPPNGSTAPGPAPADPEPTPTSPSATSPSGTSPPATSPASTAPATNAPATNAPTTAAPGTGGLLPAISVPPIQLPLPVPPIQLPVITIPGLIG